MEESIRKLYIEVSSNTRFARGSSLSNRKKIDPE